MSWNFPFSFNLSLQLLVIPFLCICESKAGSYLSRAMVGRVHQPSVFRLAELSAMSSAYITTHQAAIDTSPLAAGRFASASTNAGTDTTLID